jgi:hypothetical protein
MIVDTDTGVGQLIIIPDIAAAKTAEIYDFFGVRACRSISPAVLWAD